MRRIIPLLMILLLVAGTVVGQDDDTGDTTDTTATTTDTTTDEPTSSVNYFFVICEDRAILDLDGTMQEGYDLFVQVFRDLGAGGDQLTTLLQVGVDGAFTVSPDLVFAEGTNPVAFGQFASATITIAAEGDISDVLFNTTVEDVQDGCVSPAYDSVPTTAGGSTAATLPTVIPPGFTIDPITGELRELRSGDIVGSSGIYRPDGQLLNPILYTPPESTVQIGSRPSDQERELGRTENPGLVFAECEDYIGADPGRLYDTDGIILYWSWFASTPQQVYDHINNAIYDVTVADLPIPFVEIRPVVRLGDGNYWVFYVATLGDSWRPGTWDVEFKLTWRQPITDGYQTFGPGTAIPGIDSGCQFTIEENPYGVDQPHIYPTDPLQQFLTAP